MLFVDNTVSKFSFLLKGIRRYVTSFKFDFKEIFRKIVVFLIHFDFLRGAFGLLKTAIGKLKRIGFLVLIFLRNFVTRTWNRTRTHLRTKF